MRHVLRYAPEALATANYDLSSGITLAGRGEAPAEPLRRQAILGSAGASPVSPSRPRSSKSKPPDMCRRNCAPVANRPLRFPNDEALVDSLVPKVLGDRLLRDISNLRSDQFVDAHLEATEIVREVDLTVGRQIW